MLRMTAFCVKHLFSSKKGTQKQSASARYHHEDYNENKQAGALNMEIKAHDNGRYQNNAAKHSDYFWPNRFRVEKQPNNPHNQRHKC